MNQFIFILSFIFCLYTGSWFASVIPMSEPVWWTLPSLVTVGLWIMAPFIFYVKNDFKLGKGKE